MADKPERKLTNKELHDIKIKAQQLVSDFIKSMMAELKKKNGRQN